MNLEPSYERETLYDVATPFSLSIDGMTAVVWGARLAGSSSPEAPRVLLLHGNPADLDDWRILGPLLCPRCAVVAADLPGFGRSDIVRSDADGSRLAPSVRAMIALADSLGWSEPFVVVGHSYGAAVAQGLAARFPDRVAGIVLVGSLGWPAHAVYRLLDTRLVGGLIAALVAILRRGWFVSIFRLLFGFWARRIFSPSRPTREEIDARLSRFLQRPDFLVAMVEAARGSPSEELRSLAGEIRTRVLVLHGAEDRLVPSRNVKNLVDCMNAVCEPTNFQRIPRAGHMLHLSDAPDIARRILTWL